jgi:hypothetical protein
VCKFLLSRACPLQPHGPCPVVYFTIVTMMMLYMLTMMMPPPRTAGGCQSRAGVRRRCIAIGQVLGMSKQQALVL